MGQCGIDCGGGEFGGDELRLQTNRRHGVGQPGLVVIPAFAGSAGAVSAATAGEHDEVGVADQAGPVFGVGR